MDLRTQFGFTSTPFTREIRPEEQLPFTFFEEALAGLKRCIEARMSGALIAPPGSGKSALLRRLRHELPEARYKVFDVKITDVPRRELCREVARVCEVQSTGSYSLLIHRLQERFQEILHSESRRTVLVIDEAGDLRLESLGLFRLLTNFDMDSALLLSVLLCGQPRLKTLLDRDDQQAVARRLYHFASLRLLSREELVQYVNHRCTIAGARTSPFDPGAVEAFYEVSRGNMRVVDLLALKSLERAALAKQSAIGVNHVIEARKELWP
jgi:general secretion pathway protein A